MKLTEAQLRSRVRRQILSSMGDSAPVVYEGFLGDVWEKIKGGAEKAAVDAGKKADVPEDAAGKAAKDGLEKMTSAESTVSKLEKIGSPDAWLLLKAMHGVGTDEGTIQKVFARRKDTLAALSKEYAECITNAQKVFMTAEGAADEFFKNTGEPASLGAKVGAALGTAAVIGAWLNPALFAPAAAYIGSGALLGSAGAASATLAGKAMIGGAAAGAIAGAGKDVFKKVSGFFDNKMDPDITLVDALKDEGMDDEAAAVESALYAATNEGTSRKVRISKTQLRRIIENYS